MKRCAECQTEFDSPTWECPGCGHAPQRRGDIRTHAPELADAGDGFPPEAFAELARLEAENFWFRSRNKLIAWALKRHFDPIGRYLEIGCGTGFVLTEVLKVFPGVRATGSEIFSAGLPYAAERVADTELIQMDARNVPYSAEFDVIGAFDVLEHIDEDEGVLSEMYRAVKPGGGIAITVPQHPWLWSAQDDYACHKRRYRIGEMRRKIEDAGFTVELSTSFVSFLLPLMFLSRIRQRKADAEFDLMAELRLPGPVNRTLETVMNIERKAIDLGLRFPFGGSLVILARKPGAAE